MRRLGCVNLVSGSREASYVFVHLDVFVSIETTQLFLLEETCFISDIKLGGLLLQ